VTLQFPRMNYREVVLLKEIARRGGIHRPVLIPRARRRAAPSLWRRNLLEVWYRQSLIARELQGPFYALTITGWRVASTLTTTSN
jgi:hypothetical protein